MKIGKKSLVKRKRRKKINEIFTGLFILDYCGVVNIRTFWSW